MNDPITQAMQDEPQVIQADDVDAIKTAEQQASENLPPPGHEREELLKRRIDELEQQIERLAGEREVYRLDPAVLQEDREILGQVNRLNVTNKQPGRMYKWVYYGHQSFMVWKLKSMGWQVVQGEDPESAEMRDESGYRKIGDTLLMWIPEDKFAELEERAARVRKAQIEGVESALRGISRKYRDKGISLIEDPESDPRLKRRFAEQLGQKKLSDMIKEGTVPGARIGGQ